jgi:hypothetical protein
MTEQQSDYVTETQEALDMLGKGYNEPQEIIDESDLRKYRIELPNLYDDSDLDVYEFRLLAHYKRVGRCTEGTRTTAKKCHMAVSQVSIKRRSLHNKGFIQMQEVPLDDQTFSYIIIVVDKWEENFRKYSTRSHSEHPVSSREHPVRTAKERINHVKKKQKKSLSPEEIKEAGGQTQGYLSLLANGNYWMGREIFAEQQLPLVDWYHSVTGQDCTKSKRADWMKAAKEWQATGLTVTDLQAAYDMDIVWRKVFTSPNQLTTKAQALKAQKNAVSQEPTRLL